MNRVEMTVAGLTLALVAGLVGVIHMAADKPKIVETKPAPCVAGPNEMCPSADWLKDYDEWKALNDKIEGAMKKDRDLRTGWAKRLNESMPPGYYFDIEKRKFGKQPTPEPPHK